MLDHRNDYRLAQIAKIERDLMVDYPQGFAALLDGRRDLTGISIRLELAYLANLVLHFKNTLTQVSGW